MEKPNNCIVVIFGASGDLTKRKLMPALFNLYRQNALPDQFAILGVGRTSFTDDSFREKMLQEVPTFCQKKPVDIKQVRNFVDHLFYQSLNTQEPSDYAVLRDKLSAIDNKFKIGGNYLYYLATPPSLYEPIAEALGKEGLHRQTPGKNWRRLIVEKPFGYSLASALQLNARLQQFFSEDQLYRIDHYLGKETVQNVLAFRFANGIFEPLWNRNYVHHVEVTAAESIGVENRGGYYDNAGAVRDMVQNHLLQVVAMTAMEPPSSFVADAVRNETVKVFESLCPIAPEQISGQVVRGQYTGSVIRGEKIKGYREEKGVAPNSRTETFVAMKFYIENWRWGGVPFLIRTGKRLPTRVSEVVIHFKRTPHRLFKEHVGGFNGDNQLVIRIQPDEGILLKFGMKVPGSGFEIRNVNMNFRYQDLAETELPEAYQRLLLDALLGDATLYARADAVEAAWKFIDPILSAWENDPSIKVFGYPAGTWGPQEASKLFEEPGEDWRYPCKNLVEDGEYCEL